MTTKPDIQQARIASVLSANASLNGTVAQRGVHIERRVAEGWTVVEVLGERWFTATDGRFFLERDITKIGMDYAARLVREKSS